MDFPQIVERDSFETTSFVYDANQQAERVCLWEEIKQIVDLNTIFFCSSERIKNGVEVGNDMNTGLRDLKCTGHILSWSNNHVDN